MEVSVSCNSLGLLCPVLQPCVSWKQQQKSRHQYHYLHFCFPLQPSLACLRHLLHSKVVLWMRILRVPLLFWGHLLLENSSVWTAFKSSQNGLPNSSSLQNILDSSFNMLLWKHCFTCTCYADPSSCCRADLHQASGNLQWQEILLSQNFGNYHFCDYRPGSSCLAEL